MKAADVWAIVGAVFAGVAAAEVIVMGVREAWQRTIGRKRTAEQLLRRLATGYSLEHFVRVLGNAARQSTRPTMARRYVSERGEVSDKWEEAEEGWTEAIFAHDLMYIQAIADTDDIVRAWSVTSRSARFRPRVGPWFGGIKLHSTYAAAFKDPSSDCQASVGARRFGYWERHYGGNAGLYLWAVLTFNDAAPGGGRILVEANPTNVEGLSATEVDALRQELRKKDTFNTVGFSDTELVVPSGPDLDIVRVWRPPPGRLEALRSRIGRWMRRQTRRSPGH